MKIRSSRFSMPNSSSSLSFKKDQRGTTAIEFGIVAPLLFLLIVGMMDFGRGIFMYNTLSHAARQGARYAIVHGDRSNNPATNSTIRNLVRNQANMQNMRVGTTWPSGNNEQGSIVQVQVQCVYEPLLGLIGIPPIELKTTSRMVISF